MGNELDGIGKDGSKGDGLGNSYEGYHRSALKVLTCRDGALTKEEQLSNGKLVLASRAGSCFGESKHILQPDLVLTSTPRRKQWRSWDAGE